MCNYWNTSSPINSGSSDFPCTDKHECHFCFDQICCWIPEVRSRDSLIRCLCDAKPTFTTLEEIHHNFQVWCNYLWAVRQSSALHLAASAQEGRFLHKSFISFSGISDVTQTCWQAAVIYLLDRGAVLQFLCVSRKDKGKVFFYKLTPGVSAIYFWILFFELRQALWVLCFFSLFTLGLIPCVLRLLSNSSLLKLLTDSSGINA